jgi:transposase
MSLSAVSRKIGCSKSAVHSWKEEHKAKGDEGLKSKPVPGRPSKLNGRQKKSLVRTLVEGAMRNGYQTDLWTTRRIAQVIGKKFQISYHPNSIWWLLNEMGWSHQKPETRAKERDEKEIAHWKRHQLPHIKKVRKT